MGRTLRNYVLMPSLMLLCLALVIVWGFVVDYLYNNDFFSGVLQIDAFGILLVTAPFIFLVKMLWSRVESINVDQFIDQKKIEVVDDLFKQKIILYTGETGSGKSHALNGIIEAVVACYTPKQVMLLCIDPKRTGLEPENAESYLYADLIWDVPSALEKLTEAVADFSRKENETKLIVLIDEVSDIMNHHNIEFEAILSKISEIKSIYLVISTSRPSDRVLTPKLMSFVGERIDLPSRYR